MMNNQRYFLPQIGWPVYDLRRRKFGICIDLLDNEAIVHVEGDRYPVKVKANQQEYEYPKFYINDEVSWKKLTEAGDGTPYMTQDAGYFVKHVHYHVPKDKWQYTIGKQGIEGFDRFVVEGEHNLTLTKAFVPKI